MWFTRVSIANPVLATMVMLAFVVLGLLGIQRLKVDQFPNIEFPTVVVQVTYPGAAPEIVENEVTRRVEEAVNTIAGINQLFSRSYESSSVVIVQFNLDVDGRRAADDVREKLSQVRAQLPDEVEEPKVSRFDPASRPVWTVALTSPGGSVDQQALTTFGDQVLKKRLENVRGVGAVTLVGGLEREINVYLKPQAMEALGVGVDQVVAALRADTRELPAGALRTNEAERVVQVDARLRRASDFESLVVARRAGTPVRLAQVADVVDGPQELESLALFNGRRTLALDVQKSQGENTIEVVDGLNHALEALRAQLPPGVAADVVRDNSRPIRVAVNNVRQTLLEGAALTILIVFLFLNSWRSTVITGLTLPIALVGTFGFMYAFGFSINMVTLMALSLCVGLLIDDAIVVRENIVRHVQMGKTPHDAALEGTNEIGLAVLATTLSIVAVFLPIGFMGGIIGKFFHEFGITIVAAIVGVRALGTEFVPKADFSETFVSFYTPVGSSIELTEARARQVDAIVREMPEVMYTLTTINTGQAAGRIYATMYVRLVDRHLRERNVDQMSVPLRERLARVPGITVTHVGLLDGVSGAKQISLSLQGPDLAELRRLSQRLSTQLREIPGLVDLDASLKADRPTYAVEVRRDAAADAGLSAGAITNTLRVLVAGQTMAQWRAPDDQSYDVNLRLHPQARQAADDLTRLGLVAGTNADGSARIMRLSQVADVVPGSGANQINRRDLSREVELTANTSGRALGEVSADIRRVLDATPLPPGYTYRFGGSTKDMQESFAYALQALAMAVVFIYMILASQFRSFVQPLALMTSLPLTLIGVVGALALFGSTLNIFSIIGIVMLMGLVTKNAILLVDFAIRSRAAGMNRADALLHAARVRLRPILMTTLAMIFGMVPLAFALSEGSEQRAPMGQAVIGGVITSSLLTLVVVPVVYCWLDDLSVWVRRLVRGRPASASAA
ncbi:MAG: efflux RND transporter permease subunit [Burkholderiaceae bacterium]|nr:efflux RND transporter permease subunit [Burkholderiaceae bacterium]